MAVDIIRANGFAFIGDVHLWSSKPGRRKDENYADATREAYGGA